MTKLLISVLVVLVVSSAAFSQLRSKIASAPAAKFHLHRGWAIKSSAEVTEKGDAISQDRFRQDQWYPTTVPSTVVAALVEDKVYPDPFYSMNLRSMPGCGYPIGANFSLRPMPEDSPFRSSWWYRTQFPVPPSFRGENIWLHFSGINVRANIWLNGKQIATSDQVTGTFRQYEFDVRDVVSLNGENTLAVEVFPQLESHAAGQEHGHLS